MMYSTHNRSITDQGRDKGRGKDRTGETKRENEWSTERDGPLFFQISAHK